MKTLKALCGDSIIRHSVKVEKIPEELAHQMSMYSQYINPWPINVDDIVELASTENLLYIVAKHRLYIPFIEKYLSLYSKEFLHDLFVLYAINMTVFENGIMEEKYRELYGQELEYLYQLRTMYRLKVFIKHNKEEGKWYWTQLEQYQPPISGKILSLIRENKLIA